MCSSVTLDDCVLLQESCVCVIHVESVVPAVFYQQSAVVVKPLLQTMAHQHSKVRQAAIKVHSVSNTL